MTDDERRWPDVAPGDVERRQSEDLKDVTLAGENRKDDLPDDYTDVPEPLEDDSESSLGGTTDPKASKNRRDGLRKDKSGPNEETPANRKG